MSCHLGGPICPPITSCHVAHWRARPDRRPGHEPARATRSDVHVDAPAVVADGPDPCVLPGHRPHDRVESLNGPPAGRREIHRTPLDVLRVAGSAHRSVVRRGPVPAQHPQRMIAAGVSDGFEHRRQATGAARPPASRVRCSGHIVAGEFCPRQVCRGTCVEPLVTRHGGSRSPGHQTARHARRRRSVGTHSLTRFRSFPRRRSTVRIVPSPSMPIRIGIIMAMSSGCTLSVKAPM